MAGEAPVEPPKTTSAIPVPEANLNLQPFIYNGVVTSRDSDPETDDFFWLKDRDWAEGSGVVAGNSKVFFTSAHVLYDYKLEWVTPPNWSSMGTGPVQGSRGYFRWSAYADNVKEDLNFGQNGVKPFSKDIALAWSFAPFIEGTPAKLDYNGYGKLKSKKQKSMLTGYPRLLDYTGELATGGLYFTEPQINTFTEDINKFLNATLVSTGPSSCGGPMWIQDKNGAWSVAGIQVYTRPSEAGVYAFNSASKALMKAAAPLIGDAPKSVKNNTKGVGTSVGHYVMPKQKKIPDGLHKWTAIPFKVERFEEGYEINMINVDLNITTNHRGDLMAALLSPTGHMAIIHNGEGAGDDDLVLSTPAVLNMFNSREIMEEVAKMPNGTWSILVQDRLKGDQCVVTRAELEISVVKPE